MAEIKSTGSGVRYQPYVPAETSLAEFTFPALILGLIMSVVLGAANAYLGLKAGMTIAATYPAAVISMALLRIFRGSILEENRVAVAEVFVSISNHTAEGEHQIASVKAEEYGVPIGLSGPLWDSTTLHSMFVARANAHIGDTAKAKVGIVLVGHGQPDEWDVEFPTETEHEIEFRRRILAALEADGYRRENMDLAWMEFKDPKPAEKIEHLIKNGVEKILYFSAAISAESIHSQFDIPDLVNKAKVPAGFPIINLGAWNDDPIVIQAIKEKIMPLMPERYFISTSDQLDYVEVER